MQNIPPTSSGTVCVLGGSGFVGMRLLHAMEGKGVRIRVLSRRMQPKQHVSASVQVLLGDLLNFDSLVHFLERDSLVINLAYLHNRHPSENILAADNLARACMQVGVRKLVHVSTAVVVGTSREDIITEETLCEPKTEYEQTKLQIERLFFDQLSDRCRLTVLRPTEIFGEGGRGLLRVAKLVHDAGWDLRLMCGLFGKKRLHFIDVDNVVAAISFMTFADSMVEGQTYLVSDDEANANSFQGVVNLLSESLGHPHPNFGSWNVPLWLVSFALKLKGRSDINPNRVYSSAKLRRLGFQLPVPFEVGIKRYGSWLARTSFFN